VSRRSAVSKHNATADEHQRELVKLIREFSQRHHLHGVFSDFVEICALSISNSVDQPQFGKREKRYLEIVGKYTKDEINRFAQMFAQLVLSFEKRVEDMRVAGAGLTDVLGETYMMLEISNARAGQFFTPYEISRLMAKMIIGDGGDAVKLHGFMRLQEPACGAAGMVIAAAESLHDTGHNYQDAMHATCIDIDPCCVHMAYVQLSLLHIPAIVVHGNALSAQVWGLWYTPAHILGGWRWKLRARREATDGDPVATSDGRSEAAEEVAPASQEPVDGDIAIAEAPVAMGASVTDLFEDAVQATPAQRMFDAINQLSLF
jgi:N-6 DNA methylase